MSDDETAETTEPQDATVIPPTIKTTAPVNLPGDTEE